MKRITKVKEEIEKVFNKILIAYPDIDSLSCDIDMLQEKEFIFNMQSDIKRGDGK